MDKTAYEVINHACDELELSREAEWQAKLFSESALASTEVNNTRRVIAAASVYASALLVNRKVTQKEVSRATGVSTNPIRQTYQAILEHRGYDLGDDRPTKTRQSRYNILKTWLSRVLRP